jgi:mono/diheme cytochrome c family protein
LRIGSRSEGLSVSRWTRYGSLLGMGGLAIFVAGAVLTVTTQASSQGGGQNSPWVAPVAAKSVRNPVRVTPAGLKAASELFQQVCASCHGPNGAGDGVLAKTLTPKPANFTDTRRMRRETDGELFWKITQGRAPMPSWLQLSDTQRWQLVNYLRSLSARGVAVGKRDSAGN